MSRRALIVAARQLAALPELNSRMINTAGLFLFTRDMQWRINYSATAPGPLG